MALGLGLMIAHPSRAQSVDAPLSAAQIAALRGTTDLYLEVTIGAESTHLIVSFRKRNEHLSVQAKDLEALGVELAHLKLAAPQGSSDGWIELDTVQGLTYHVDEAHQTIDLTIDNALRKPYSLGRRRIAPPTATTGTGLIFNYDAYAATSGTLAAYGSLDLSSEQRWFGPCGVLSNTGLTTIDRDQQHYVRESTTYQFDDPTTMTSYEAGDALSSSLSWTRPVRFGGFEISRNFSLRPDLVTFPIPQLSGSAALPSTVDLYVNNVHQMSSEVPSGPFVINGAATIVGAGLATVVVHDAMGRAVSASLPLYIDNRLLAPGLTSYSVEGGLLRYNYGLASFDYQGHPAASGTYRYGVNNSLTLETHGEATPELLNAGVGALLRAGEAGVVNASLTGSADSSRQSFATDVNINLVTYRALAPMTPITTPAPRTTGSGAQGATGPGAQGSLGYQFLTPAFSVSAQTTRAIRNYADLAAVGGTPAPRYLDQVTASVPCAHEQTIGGSLVHLGDAITGRSQIVQGWYSARVTHFASTFVNLSRDFDQTRSASISIGIAVDFGNRISGFGSGGSSGGRGQYGTSLSRSADYGGGWEWAAQTNRSGDASASLVRGGYLGQYGEVVAAVQQAGGHDDVSVEATGGALLMDGVVEPARRIGAAFALVSTDGTGAVPVFHENRFLGTTDDSGHLLVPDLNPYERNNLSIDTLNLPAEDKIPTDHLEVTPRGESGVLARFPIDHYLAGTVTLLDAHGRPLPAGTALHVLESGRDFVVGYDGMAFIEGLAAQNHLIAQGPNFSCHTTVVYRRASGTAGKGSLLDLGKVTCNEAQSI